MFVYVHCASKFPVKSILNWFSNTCVAIVIVTIDTMKALVFRGTFCCWEWMNRHVTLSQVGYICIHIDIEITINMQRSKKGLQKKVRAQCAMCSQCSIRIQISISSLCCKCKWGLYTKLCACVCACSTYSMQRVVFFLFFLMFEWRVSRWAAKQSKAFETYLTWS